MVIRPSRDGSRLRNELNRRVRRSTSALSSGTLAMFAVIRRASSALAKTAPHSTIAAPIGSFGVQL